MRRHSLPFAVLTVLLTGAACGSDHLRDTSSFDAGSALPATDAGTSTTADAGCDGGPCRPCTLPGYGELQSGSSVVSYPAASAPCGVSCGGTLIRCDDGQLSGGDSMQFASCYPEGCGGCPAVSVDFDWGTHADGPCHLQIPFGTGSNWYLTSKTDDFVGGVFANCNAATQTWEISQEECVPRGGADSCFPTGTRCDGNGPALFPYPHCWTCCHQTDPAPGTCK